MRRPKSTKLAQRFVTAHATVFNLFNFGRHLVRGEHCRDLRIGAFSDWNRSAAWLSGPEFSLFVKLTCPIHPETKQAISSTHGVAKYEAEAGEARFMLECGHTSLHPP